MRLKLVLCCTAELASELIDKNSKDEHRETHAKMRLLKGQSIFREMRKDRAKGE